MQQSDFGQLIEQRLAALEMRLEQVDLRLAGEVKKALSIAGVDLPFTLAKARLILESVIQDIYRRELPQGKPKPLFDMIEALLKVDGLFTRTQVNNINYIRINGNLLIHAQDEPIAVEEREVEAVILLTFNVVEWYLVRYRPAKTGAAVAPVADFTIPPNPYRGLAAFREEDSAHFFGRDQDAEDLAVQAAAQPLATVVGASGSGKSSLVFAGLFPRLRAHGSWRLAAFRPGDRPFEALAAVLAELIYEDKIARAEKTKELAEKFAGGQVDLATLVDLALEGSGDRLLLVVDQFEEVFTLTTDPTVRARFLDLLCGAVPSPVAPGHRPAPGGGHCLLLTLRADFMAHALCFAPLARAFNRYAPKMLGPIEDAESLRAVIADPARQSDVTCEPLLIERILRDLRAQPAGAGEPERISLPLLQFTLERLWQRQTERTLTHLAYEEIGGVQQALARHADGVLARLAALEQERLRHIFTQLVCPGEGTEDTRQVATKAQIGEAHWDLVTRLADERLVVTGRDAEDRETVELIHEALLRHWPPLRQWMGENRRFRLWQNRLRLGLQEWENHARDPDALLHGARLAEAEDWLHRQAEALSPPERAFIQAGIDARERAIRARRRGQRLLVVGLSLGLVGALALAAFAWVQSDRATRANRVATLSRNQAEDLVNYMLVDLRNKLIPVGRVDLLEKVARKAEEYFEQLKSADASTESEHKRGVVLYNIGEVYNAKGDLPQAMAAWEKGLAIAERLTSQNPENAEWLLDLSGKHHAIAILLQGRGDLKGATEHYKTSHAIMERLVQRDPDNIDWRLQLAGSLQSLNQARFLQDDRDGALTAAETNLRTVAQLAQKDPDNALLQSNLAVFYRDVGDFRMAQGDRDEALAAYQSSQSITERLAHRYPDDHQYQTDLAANYDRIGTTKMKKGDLEAARAAFEAGQAITERLAARDPDNLQWQHNLIIGLKKIGAVQGGQGHLDLALTSLNRALEIAKEATRRSPSQSTLQEDLLFVYEAIGGVKEAQDNSAEALTAYEAALTIRERLVQQAPTNVAWQLDLSNLYEYTGNIKQSQGDLPGASTAFEADLVIAKNLAQRYPQDPDRQHNLSERYYAVGEVRQAQGDLSGALAAFDADLAISRELAQKNPNDPVRQRGVAISYRSVGEVRQAQGDLSGALDAFEADLAISKDLALGNPTDVDVQINLSASYLKVGGVRMARGELTEALSAFDADLENTKRMIQESPTNAAFKIDLGFVCGRILAVTQAQDKIAETKYAQGDLAGALAMLQASRSITEKLPQDEPTCQQWQSELLDRQMKIGNLLKAQGDFSGARSAFQAGLAIAENLAREEPDNAQRRRPTAILTTLVADVNIAEGKVGLAISGFRTAETIARDLYAKQPDDMDRRLLTTVLGKLSGALLYDRKYKAAIAAAEEALALDPNQLWILGNLAHGYLLSGRLDKARPIYSKHATDKLNDRQTFAQAVLDDFQTLRKNGIDHPDMKKIESMLQRAVSSSAQVK